MASSISKWDETTAASEFRKRRRWRFAIYSLATLFVFSIIADHLRAQNRHGDDWLRFDGHAVQFVNAIDGQSFAVRDGNSDDLTIIALQGVRSAGSEWDRKSADYLDARLAGKNLILHLQPTDPHDAQNRLKADAFLDDHQLLAADLVAEGLAIPDRATKSDFLPAIACKKKPRRKSIAWVFGLNQDNPRLLSNLGRIERMSLVAVV